MRFALLPTVIADSVTELSASYLQGRGIRLLMLDFDNTIVPYTTSDPTVQMRQWLQSIRDSDIALCVVSNSRKARVREFCDAYGLDCITHARKPFSAGIRKCMAQYNMEPQQCALVGDQIYTDVLGARSAGVQAILVRAIHNHTVWLKLRHVAEKPFIFAARKRRISHEEH